MYVLQSSEAFPDGWIFLCKRGVSGEGFGAAERMGLG